METTMTVRYHILPNIAGEGFLIIDTVSGNIQSPKCWQDLEAYHHYLVNKGMLEEAQKLLADSMAGKKPITRMLESV
jgi:hypothetical protein